MPATIASRAALRAAVVAALVAEVDAVAGRVLVGRSWPVPGPGSVAPQTLPALLVEDGPRILSAAASGFAQLRCQFRVVARVQGREDAAREAALDALDEQIRAALRGDAALADLVLVVEEIASTRETAIEGALTMAEDVHLVTLRLAGFG